MFFNNKAINKLEEENRKLREEIERLREENERLNDSLINKPKSPPPPGPR